MAEMTKPGDHVSGFPLVRLRPRLAAVASLVPPGLRVADIGTDHGRLALWLLQNGGKSVVAADLRPGPLEAARRTAREHGMEDRLRFVLSDGFLGLHPEELDLAVIAGMGGETVAAIVSQLTEEQRAGLRLVLQPQTREEELCRRLEELGYGLEAALAVRDAGRLYTAFSARWQGPGARCDLISVLGETGSPEALSWLRERRSWLERALAGHRASGREQQAREALLSLERVDAALDRANFTKDLNPSGQKKD